MSVRKQRRELLKLAEAEGLVLVSDRQCKGTHFKMRFKTPRGRTFVFLAAMAPNPTQRARFNTVALLRRLRDATDGERL